jgi:hypothetical protein
VGNSLESPLPLAVAVLPSPPLARATVKSPLAVAVLPSPAVASARLTAPTAPAR